MNITVDNYLSYIDEKYIALEMKRVGLLAEAVDLSKLRLGYKKGIEKVKSILIEHEVNPDRIINMAKKQAGKYKGSLKKWHSQGLGPNVAALKLSKEMGKDVIRVVKSVATEYSDLKLGQKIAISIVAFIVVLVVQAILSVILILLIRDPKLVVTIIAVAIAPLVEESLKTYFVAKGMPWIGTGIVFGIEAVLYVFKMMSAGMSVGKALLVRAIGLLMHFGTTAIQKKFAEADHAFAGWILAVCIHATFNVVAITFDPKIASWLKG